MSSLPSVRVDLAPCTSLLMHLILVVFMHVHASIAGPAAAELLYHYCCVSVCSMKLDTTVQRKRPSEI